MGDGTGVLFNRFLHLQGRKRDTPQEGKVTLEIRREMEAPLYLIIPFPLFLSAICLIRLKKQGFPEEEEGTDLRRARMVFSNSKGNRERQGRDYIESFAPYFVTPSPCFLSLLFLTLPEKWHPCYLSFLTCFPFSSLLLLPFN